MQDRFEHDEKLPPADTDVQRLSAILATFFFPQPPENLGRGQAHRSPHPAQCPPCQHITRVARPFIDPPDSYQQPDREDGQPHPGLGPPGASPALCGAQAKEITDGATYGHNHYGVGAWEAVARRVYELQGSGRPRTVEEQLEKSCQSPRAERRGEKDRPCETQVELSAPVRQDRKHQASRA